MISENFTIKDHDDDYDVVGGDYNNFDHIDNDGDDVVGRPTQLIFISDIHLLGWRW